MARMVFTRSIVLRWGLRLLICRNFTNFALALARYGSLAVVSAAVKLLFSWMEGNECRGSCRNFYNKPGTLTQGALLFFGVVLIKDVFGGILVNLALSLAPSAGYKLALGARFARPSVRHTSVTLSGMISHAPSSFFISARM